MTQQVLPMESLQLQCDAAGCGHIETITAVDASLIGKPCPKCGACLLTKEDFDAGVSLLGALEAINEIFAAPDDAKMVEVGRTSINPHAGKINIQLDLTAGPISDHQRDGSR